MKKMLLSIFLTTGILFSCSLVWGADWKLFSCSTSKTVFWYYDAESITRSSKDVVRVCYKKVLTEKGVREHIAIFGDMYKNVYEIKFLLEINCKDKTHCPLQMTHYAEDATVISFYNFYDREWHSFISGSVEESLYKIVCK